MPDGPVAELVTETRAWLREHPDDAHLRAALLGLIRGMPDGPVAELVTETRAWLREHPNNLGVRRALLALVPAMPDGTVSTLREETLRNRDRVPIDLHKIDMLPHDSDRDGPS